MKAALEVFRAEGFSMPRAPSLRYVDVKPDSSRLDTDTMIFGGVNDSWFAAGCEVWSNFSSVKRKNNRQWPVTMGCSSCKWARCRS